MRIINNVQLVEHLNHQGLENLTMDDIEYLIAQSTDSTVKPSMAEAIHLWNAIVSKCNNIPTELKAIYAPLEARIKEISVILFERSVGDFDEFKGLKLGEMYLRLCKLLRVIQDFARYRLHLEKSKSLLVQIDRVPLLNSVCRNRLQELRAFLCLELVIIGDVIQLSKDVDGDVLGSALIEEIGRDSRMSKFVECFSEVQFSKSVKIQLYSRYIEWLLFEKRLKEANQAAEKLHKEFPEDDTAFLTLVKCRIALKIPIEAQLIGLYKNETKALAAEMMAKWLGTGKTMELVPELALHSKISLTIGDSKTLDTQKAEMIDFLISKNIDSLEGEERCVFQLFDIADKASNIEMSKKLFTLCLLLAEKTKSNVEIETIKKRLFDCSLVLGQVDEAKRLLGDVGWEIERFKLACIEEDRKECLRIAQNCVDDEVSELITILQDYDSIGIERELMRKSLKDVQFIVLLHLMIERRIEVEATLILNRIQELIVNEENSSGLWNLGLVAFNQKFFELCKKLTFLFKDRFALGEEEKRAALVLLILSASEFTETSDSILLEEIPRKSVSKRKRSFIKLETEELPLITRLAMLKLKVKLGMSLEEDEDELDVFVRLAQLLYFDLQIDQSGTHTNCYLLVFGKVLGRIVQKSQGGQWNEAIPVCVRSILEGEHFMREQIPLALIVHLAKRGEYPEEERVWITTFLYNRALKYKAYSNIITCRLSEYEKCKELARYAQELAHGEDMKRLIESLLCQK